MNGIDHPTVRAYLDRLGVLSRGLPEERRAELLADIEEHLVDATAATDGSEVALRDVLERLGPPEDVVAEAAGGARATAPLAPPPAPPGRPGLEMVALTLLVLSLVLSVTLVLAVLAPLPWLVGLVLLLLSARWTPADKVWGVLAYGVLGMPLVWVAGFMAAPLWFAESCTGGSRADGTTFEECTGGPPAWWPVVVVAVALAVLGLWVWTGLRLRRSARRAATLAAATPLPVPG